MANPEKLEEAKKRKDAGNDLFKQGKWVDTSVYSTYAAMICPCFMPLVQHSHKYALLPSQTATPVP